MMSKIDEIKNIPTVFKKCYDYKDASIARESGFYPFFKPIQRNSGTKVYIDGRELLMAGSNNYLGLANDPRLKEAAESVVEQYGTSCSGSRFMNEHSIFTSSWRQNWQSLWGKRLLYAIPQDIRQTLVPFLQYWEKGII